MSVFRRQLDERQPDPMGRRWLFVPYDQLSHKIGPLSKEPPDEVGIAVVECPAKAGRRPYHKQKLALVLANLRHFCLEQAERGVAVRHLVAKESYAGALKPLALELGPLRVMRPAERELRADLAPLVKSGALEVVPHEGWLTSTEDFAASHPDGPPYRMDRFYRHVRRVTGVLMENGKPVGGKLSFDTENRKAWRGEPPAPKVPGFRPDEVTNEVLELVQQHFADHPGELDGRTLPATAAHAQRVWRWAREACLPVFGPYQDAMSSASSSLFHTRISQIVNLGRLLPRDVVRDAERMDLPLASKEGFIRQVLGWREFVRHVHEATDGFRTCESAFLGSSRPLPAAWWGAKSGLACLDRCVSEVWREGYGHHITRLMVLSNLATLLDVDPRALTDWFWCGYSDAFDWVVEPNVLGMGTFAVGDLMTTKPYVAGSAYIDRMSDYCGDCAFDPKKDCPVRPLYWAFLDRHRDQLEDNPRLKMPMRSLARRSQEQRGQDQGAFRKVRQRLDRGEMLEPEA